MGGFGDRMGEILHNIRSHKLRVLLTGFAVSWGIFMLVVLLGAGYGLENGVRRAFAEDAVNSLWVYPGQTSLAHHGLRQGRHIQLRNPDHSDLKTHLRAVELSSARLYLWGDKTIRFGDKASRFDVVGVHADFQAIENLRLLQGRPLNPRDSTEIRKTAIIGKMVARELFGDTPIIGQFMTINGVAFQVVGVFHDPGDDRQEETIYIPLATLQRVYTGDDRIHNMAFTIAADDMAASQAVEKALLTRLAARLRFDAEDERAVFIHNTFEEYTRYMTLFANIRTFIWLVGIGSIVAGIVGISNIMLITVKERTREIGIRKALGATPRAIIDMILTEAILTTVVFGYLGLVAGIGALEVAARLIRDVDYFHNPAVNLWVAFGAMGLLVVCGTLAGIFPARRAAVIRPVEALRDE
ncbi:MAG: ABC transporter permease [Desulfosarcinaceae bacterium]|nr:ABC transporter permease [Desulfosarcinaceae bacterium]